MIELDKGKNHVRVRGMGNSWTLESTENVGTRKNTQKIQPPMDASAKIPWPNIQGNYCQVTRNLYFSVSIKSKEINGFSPAIWIGCFPDNEHDLEVPIYVGNDPFEICVCQTDLCNSSPLDLDVDLRLLRCAGLLIAFGHMIIKLAL